MSTCPVAIRLWLLALARVELDAETMRAAMRLLDAWRVRERC